MELRKRKKLSNTNEKVNYSKTKKLRVPETLSSNFRIENYLLDNEWKEILKDEFEKDYFLSINNILSLGYEKNCIRPDKELVFNVFNSTRLSDIKCVILGQDPYHDDGQAQGLAFSVPKNIKIPRTLQNIFAELKNDIPEFEHDESLGGCLEKWTQQGVFLLNAFLTVEAHKAGSHAKIGWDIFTNKIISLISDKKENCVFILWGNFAHKKENLIDAAKHKIIKCAHPSPLSFNKFFNSKCFSQTNEFLKEKGIEPIKWSLK
ncbi:unnamed protein product [Brachionus calyciflorus]|uniref:Uracil-DNA glycosylase n=1 Tax=Brachionus calyciflorus TaxID=104777 RepID=A0A813MH69_9BILA|nr:unnamed protein product [Brachionus calyciflorus]